MKIIRDGKEINALAITYFTPKGKRFFGLDKDNEYLIYTIPDESKEKTLYLAKLNHIDDTIRLILPNEEELKFLKGIIENFLSDRFNLRKLTKYKYEYIDIKKLENKIIEEKRNQKIILSTEKYIKLLSNKNLTYPKLKILNIEEIMKEGYDKNNKEAIPICMFALLIYFVLVVILHIILMFNGLGQINLFKLSGPTIILWTMVVSLISMVAFNFEEKNGIESWLVVFLIIFIFTFLLSIIQNNLLIPSLTLMSLIYSIIFTIPYAISKVISFKVVNKLKARNYLTYFCIYFLPFTCIFLVLVNIYNRFLSNIVSNIINMI